jgi:hypothetical protein
MKSTEFKRNLDRASLSPEAAKPKLEIAMTEREKILFDGLLRCTRNYLEFGSGGSTVRAAESVSGKIVSIDSSQQWLQAVHDAMPPSTRTRTSLVHIDIGPVGEWGHPIVRGDAATWARYSLAIWETVDGGTFDLFLIDGRFRVACFAETVRHASPNAVILVHDYVGRPQYHVMESIARRVTIVDQLALFAPTGASPNLIDSVSNAYRSVSD